MIYIILSDLRELKAILEINPANTAEDKKLYFFLEQASNLIEECLNRTGKIFLKTRTEFYRGTGTERLLLRARPVYADSTLAVLEDPNAYYGSASGAFTGSTATLTYGTDFALQIDQEDGLTSRSGILLRIGDFWFKPQARNTGYLAPFINRDTGSYKITYNGGYTYDNMPAGLRAACNLLVARMRYIMPLGMAIGGEGYEERSLALIENQRDYLMGLVKPLILNYRNRYF